MRKYKIILIICALSLTQPIFAADDSDEIPSKQCELVVNTCLNAGYTRDNSSDKAFWMACMKPILLGKTVEGVSLDAKDVKACRVAKIKELQQKLKELKSVKS